MANIRKLTPEQISLCDNSTVRNNLLTRPNYTPYCGSEYCLDRWPRTYWSDIFRQFKCTCGWTSSFPQDFINEYLKVKNNVRT